MESLVCRVTPLTVLPDIVPTAQQYRDLGFDAVETGNPDCVGLRAGNSYLILATVDHMAGDFPSAAVEPLVGKTIPYIHVRSIEIAKERLPPSAVVVDQTSTRGGTIEALVERDGQYVILAEKE